MQYIFEWDFNKAKINVKKHGISFEDATDIFRDKMMISIFDEKHSDNEDRWITIGMDKKTRTLVVVHTYISINKDKTKIRLISARRATKKEAKIYLEG